MTMDKNELQNLIAKRVAQELESNYVVNLGIGLPTLVANHVPEGKHIIFQSENGFVGLGPTPTEEQYDEHIYNAGGKPVTIETGGAFFGSDFSFGIIRGGHVDITVLGALQVDAKGNIANYMIPGKLVPGMGGAMDLVTGARKVIVAMEHTNKGEHKILEECTLPLTGVGSVDLIVTEMGVIEVTDRGLEVLEVSNGFTFEELQEATSAKLIKSDKYKETK